LGRQERDVVFVVALNTIQRGNLYRTNAHTGIFAEVPFQIGLVNSRTEPPPAGAGLGFRQWGRTLLGEGCGKTAAYYTGKEKAFHFVNSL
jgi:hypothetical protein